MWQRIFHPAVCFLITTLLLSYYVGAHVPATWTCQTITLDVKKNENGELSYKEKDIDIYVANSLWVPLEDASLNEKKLNSSFTSKIKTEEFCYKTDPDGTISYYKITAQRHWGLFSLLPALVAIGMCWITKQPIPSLFSGILSGSFILGKYDVLSDVLIAGLSTQSSAIVLMLYLWLLGGLLGVWAKTGAAHAFSTFMTRYFVKGPRSAKLVTWILGIIFFQGGTVSAVLVGTTVRPLVEQTKVSPEEFSYIVDSTASPIAALLAFNAWPGYVQSFIYVSGVSWLATEHDRVAFFFRCIPLNFYAILAIICTLLLSFDIAPFVGKQMKEAMNRSKALKKCELHRIKAHHDIDLQPSHIPLYYKPSVYEFFIPLFLLITTAVTSFIVSGSPNVLWAFGLALISSIIIALMKGMTLKDLIEGLDDGFKGVVVGSIILLLAMIIGNVNRDTGSGSYLVALLQNSLPYWLLPILLQIITVIISFSTGTSWGTYAIAFPIAMPLSWAIANSVGLQNPEMYMAICFASVINGSLYGDQCSPISDTTVLSAMCTGCDLMDHVKTQLPQATMVACCAGIGWTLCALWLT